jgi:hypothetical protein
VYKIIPIVEERVPSGFTVDKMFAYIINLSRQRGATENKVSTPKSRMGGINVGHDVHHESKKSQTRTRPSKGEKR